jgi:cytochrome c biogenesis factor
VSGVRAFNERVALIITEAVGTMACAYVFAGLALVSLPAALGTGSLIIIVAWTAQTFLQLVLLSVILLGSKLATARTEATINATHEETAQALAHLSHVVAELTDAQNDLHHLLADIDTCQGDLHQLVTQMNAVVRATHAGTAPTGPRIVTPQ